MQTIPKQVKKQVREWCNVAYERELTAELEKLHTDFHDWKSGKLNCFDLTDRIHDFRQNAARDLYKIYVMGPANAYLIAGALERGVLKEDELPPTLLELAKR